MEPNKQFLLSDKIPTLLQVIGSIYSLLSLMAGIGLTFSKVTSLQGSFLNEISIPNYSYRALGYGLICSSIIILLLCLGVARIISQNIYILKHLSDNNNGSETQ